MRVWFLVAVAPASSHCDPTLYDLLAQVYPGHHIPADIYHGRNIP